MINRRRLGMACAVGLLLGCVSSVGGWDDSALLEAEPQLAAIPGQRIGDMTPYPAIEDGRLLLVACRYAEGGPVPVSVSVLGSGSGAGTASQAGPGRVADWAALAIGAVGDAVPGVELTMLREGEWTPGLMRVIEIVSIEDPEAEIPYGLADTLSECDVSRTQDSRNVIRGSLTRSEIRIRRLLRDQLGRARSASEAEWIGALMHELGHALGFAGHAAVGDSLVLLEESRLRALGRRALEGEPVPAPNLTALYSLAPGRILGEAEVSAQAREMMVAVEALVADRNARLGTATGPFASTGDQAARLVWRWAGGLRVELRFPFWRREIERGHSITVLPGEATRGALARAS